MALEEDDGGRKKWAKAESERREADDKEMPDPTSAHTAIPQQAKQCEQSTHTVRARCGMASWLCSLAGVAAKRREWGIGRARRWHKKSQSRYVRARWQRAHKAQTYI